MSVWRQFIVIGAAYYAGKLSVYAWDYSLWLYVPIFSLLMASFYWITHNE